MNENRERPRVADTIAATLYEHGGRHAFGMPGGEVITLVDALEKAGIRFHLARHETAAASMAAGASLLSGGPGILVTTVGPGLANAVNGIADALQERVPLVVLSGIVDRSTRTRYTHQVIDHAALLRPIVKASFEVEPESAASTVARALAIACAAPMGPVHLDLSPAVAATDDPAPRIVRPATIRRPSVVAGDAVVASLAKRLDAARRPIILAGFEAARDGAGEAIRRLAEKIEAPVVTTYKGKGLIDETHPLSLGAAGLSPAADRVLLALFNEADLVLMVGYDPIEMRLGWLDTVDPDRTVELSAAPPDHAMHHCSFRFVANTAATVEVLAEAVADHSSWAEREPAGAANELKRIFGRPHIWGPHAIIEVLNETVGPDALVTVDSGAHRILLSQKWVCRRPLSLIQSAGFCTMAAALPLAIGAKVADPSRRVIAVMGDGGLEMGVGELATLRDLALPLTIVVFQDCSLALIAMKQRASGLARAGVTLGQTDFARLAEGFGGYGVNVDDALDLQRELSAAESRSNFTLISCRFDADAYQDAF
ncbi:thiamine pyrophosphate-binding protein [Sinorhizobium arboris]|uniref:thiamine pyrophosphate-binding protein n=1 Tax=Sinorhizobium arboris TaxID=76745 RepID=UPI0004882A1C|nr:thiamine pyrophosphate-binding protein [Sinorhizobium arboris]